MNETFEQWFNLRFKLKLYDSFDSYDVEAAWNHQQKKIDQLQKRLEAAEKLIQQLVDVTCHTDECCVERKEIKREYDQANAKERL